MYNTYRATMSYHIMKHHHINGIPMRIALKLKKVNLNRLGKDYSEILNHIQQAVLRSIFGDRN